MAFEFPAFIKLEHQPDGSAKSSFLAEVDNTLDSAERRFQQFSDEARRQLDQAMTTRRNTFGSLDLGVEDLRKAAQAQQARAIAAREVARATALAAKEEGDYGRQARLSVAATEALAREEEEAARAALQHAAAVEQVQAVLNRQASATDVVAQATGRGTTANRMMVTSQRAVRVAGLQAGQQLTDIAIQMEMGTRASTIFAQQVPQLAFALSGLEGSANKTHARIGKFATFLSGPWGAAFFIATAVMGPFVAKLFESGDAADDSARSQRSLADVLRDTKSSYEEVKKALDEYNRAQEKEREITLLSLADQSRAIAGNLNEAISIREKTRAILESYDAQLGNPIAAGQGGQAVITARGIVASQIDRQTAKIAELQEAARNTGIEIADLMAEMQSSPEARIKSGFEVLREEARKSITDIEALTQRLAELNRQEKAALDAIRESSRARGAANEASLGDMVALVKQLFPGATVTSTYRPGDRGDHGQRRAIDFIPAGGMGQYTTAQVEQILRDAGVDIRRNARGTQQLFGPGRSANRPGDHDDHFHFAWQGGAPDPERVAEALRKADEALREFGNRSAESIARINERFDEQPRLIDQAARATRELDNTIAELAEKKPVGFEQMIADAEAAKGVIEDALVRPFEDLAEDSARRLEIERLILAGRETEAAVLETIWQIEERIGTLTDAQRDAVRDVVEAREAELEAIRRLHNEQSAYLDATRSVRSEIEAIFAGRGSIANFRQIFADLNARVLTERLFGDIFEELDDSMKAQFGRAVDQLERDAERTGKAFLSLADAADIAAARLRSPAPSGTGFDAAFGPAWQAQMRGIPELDGGEIVVTAPALEQGVMGMTPERYFELMSRRIMQPIVDELADVVGPRLAEQIGGVLSGALYGYSTAGTTGGILGGLKGVVDNVFGGAGGKLSGLLGGALGGAQTGSLVSGLAGAFGLKLSGTAAQIGGAIGSFLPIPGGDLIGAVAGGLLSKIFGSAKYGTASLTGGSGLSVRAKGDGRSQGATTLGGAVQEALANIAEQLDAEIGAFRVSIGTYKDSFRVSTTGRTGKLKDKYGDVRDFGDDQGAAIAFAVLDAIKDGAIKGIRAGTQRLLRSGSDVEKALQDALAFEGVFTRLARLKDPVGAAMDDLDDEFSRLKDLFKRAGASTQEWKDLEELYWLERDQIVKEAMERSLGSLRGFLDELTIGNSALSLRDRKSAALARFNPLADRVAAGDTTAYDEFVEASRALLDIERQMSGSQQGYFDLLSRVTSLTQGALSGSSGAPLADRDSPFGPRSANDNAAVVSGISGTNRLLEDVRAGIVATNQNLGTLIAQGRLAPGSINYGIPWGGW